MGSSFQAPRGARDLLPDEVALHRRVEAAARDLFRLFGYREIRPPLFEEAALFERSVGEATDIVEKEMFEVVRGEDRYAFRPEGTAGVVRAFLEHQLHRERGFWKFFYVGPMFRFERPQKGRERQFDQIGVEALGSADPALDAEVVHLASLFFERLSLEGLEVRLSSMGDGPDREAYRERLRAWVGERLARLCETCRARFERNVFRILDCKEEGCRALVADAPRILDSLGPENRAHFDVVRRTLAALGRPATVDPGVARGLDYYTRTVFEIHAPGLGARSALCGGGRYDHLVQTLGGPPVPAVGFAIGVTPTVLALREAGAAAAPPEPEVELFVAPLGPAAREEAIRFVDAMRRAGVACDLDHEGRGLKAQLRGANRLGALASVVLGEEEVRTGRARIKALATGREQEVALADAATVATLVRAMRAP